LMRDAPSLRMQEDHGAALERDAEAERENALQEEQQLGQFLHTRYGTEMESETPAARREVLVQRGGAGRKLLSQ